MNLEKAKIISRLLLGIFAVLMLILVLTLKPVFGYIASAVMGVYGIFLLMFWRCPKCGKNLGALWVKCCPNCGEKIN